MNNFFQKFWRKKNISSNLPSEDEPYVADSKSALLTKSTPLAHAILIVCILLIFCGLIWAYFGKIEEIAIGEGKVIPSSQIKIIQSLDGGIVSSISVKEGDLVKTNQMLMQLDITRYKADYEQAFAKYIALLAIVARYEAEVNNEKEIHFPEILKKFPDLEKRETNLFLSRKKALEENLKILNESHKLAMKEVNMYKPLLSQGYASQLEYNRAIRNANEVQIQIHNERDKFRENVLTELNSKRAELAIVMEQLTSLRDKMIRTVIRSPVNGIVKKLNIVTVGGVIKPGEVIMEIVPLEDTLLIQARIWPKDIGFIHVGQPATVKISAYDYSIYRGLTGRVEYISPDAIADDLNMPESKRQYYFLVNVRTDTNHLKHGDRRLYIMPGMMATIHIKTGEKTVLQYLLKPLIKAKDEALTER